MQPLNDDELSPLTAAGRSEDLPVRREREQMQRALSRHLGPASRWSGQKVGVHKIIGAPCVPARSAGG